ncbi:MAG TPA: DNA polymerase III subunit alpha, partial [Ktedonobacterales bacterium]|nr:DNA polymerase III subunit alpha [Ktedonobacterales bacterium]
MPTTDTADDDAPAYVELHCASAFSFLRAGSAVEALVARAAQLGMRALALTDYMTLAGVVHFQTACAVHGIQGIVGVELAVADPDIGDTAPPARLVALARNPTGYARLCQLLTDANLADPDAPVIPFAALAEAPDGLFILTGGRDGPLARPLLAGQRQQAEALARRYAAAFGPDRVWVELQHHLLPESIGLMQRLAWVAEAAGLRCIATNGVCHATREDYPLYDLLTCVRLGICVDQPHAERPRNDEAYLKRAGEMAALFAPLPWGASALAAAGALAAQCHLSLLKGVCTAPRVPLPAGHTPASHLRTLCEQGLATRFPQLADPTIGCAATHNCEFRQKRQYPLSANPEIRQDRQHLLALDPDLRQKRRYPTTGLSEMWQKRQSLSFSTSLQTPCPPCPLWFDSSYRRQLEHELAVISRLELEEFFLCVHDIVSAARAMGIRCSGRGSAANSLVAYLLGITGVDPLHHGLLFERFLNPERRGMPDIDIDIQSDRRDELIRYVEGAYTERHAAMVANVNTYRTRGALRDAAKALGFPLPLVNFMTKVLPHHTGRAQLAAYHNELARVVATCDDAQARARCLRRLPLLLRLAPRIVGLPRHLSLHNGGMVLSREPLADLLPVRISANGVRALEVDKDDVERLGLIKFDLLGLRTLGAIEEALALIEETTGSRPNVDSLPTDPPDAATMDLVRAGQTLAVFQIESPGQWHLLAQTQPQTVDDLIVQTALFRPGPLQANMVHPYVTRRQQRQRDAVQTPWHGTPPDDFWTRHPVLGAILRDTEGILLFQEQILEIAHQFAGLSYAEADGFRRAMSHSRTPDEMEAMRERFASGVLARGEALEDATRVFDAISNFVGYGFCKSHAAEFARTIYQTAWLKAHYPAHYLAAFLTAQPAGFFPPHVVLEEAKLLGIPVLPVDINRSEDRFTVERVGTSNGRQGRWAIRLGLRQVAHVGDELAQAILWERRRLNLVGF